MVICIHCCNYKQKNKKKQSWTDCIFLLSPPLQTALELWMWMLLSCFKRASSVLSGVWSVFQGMLPVSQSCSWSCLTCAHSTTCTPRSFCLSVWTHEAACRDWCRREVPRVLSLPQRCCHPVTPQLYCVCLWGKGSIEKKGARLPQMRGWSTEVGIILTSRFHTVSWRTIHDAANHMTNNCPAILYTDGTIRQSDLVFLNEKKAYASSHELPKWQPISRQ